MQLLPEEELDGPVIEDEDFGFECIPLQTVCNDDDDDNDDIYFLDEFGNYVFPVSTPTIPGSCSCPPSAEDLAANSRRVSQVRNHCKQTGGGETRSMFVQRYVGTCMKG